MDAFAEKMSKIASVPTYNAIFVRELARTMPADLRGPAEKYFQKMIANTNSYLRVEHITGALRKNITSEPNYLKRRAHSMMLEHIEGMPGFQRNVELVVRGSVARVRAGSEKPVRRVLGLRGRA
ncbi:Uncharacterised protein [Candidatus Norongarragalina meridionalis]|nr:Uncharacterised protein [Candidatus Norongarragalina meridionalis]